jgi:mono/diheme cytochrome c family protein
MAKRRIWLRRVVVSLLVFAALWLVGAGLAWWKLLHAEQPTFASAEDRFNYGSLDAELVAGIPYPIFMILPRVFPDLVEKYGTQGYGPKKPGWGGYGAFGLAWEQGQRLPRGLSIRRVGYERVTVNCALCHTATYRLSADADRTVVTGGPGLTVNIQNLLRFLIAASHDARFTPARLMPEIAVHFPLDWLDWQIYTFYLIPKTRLALHLAEHELGWMDQKTPWGPGRDDAFNLPKFILLQQHWDNSVSNTDFPALWQMHDREGGLMHAAGEATTLYPVTATSAFGTGSLPSPGFRERNEWIDDFLAGLPAPKYPGTIDDARAAKGQAIFAAQCASCHAKGGAQTGKAIAIADIGTDPEHFRAWTDSDASKMNLLTGALGMTGAEMQGAQGYVAKRLVGVWLLGPFLHNGSVPTLADLLSPPGNRPKVFYRGYDVLDQDKGGFTSTGPDAEAFGFRYDTNLQGNGNGGHAYGATLPPEDRHSLIEYLKTL